jgi:selenophosphate synthetase-related protein
MLKESGDLKGNPDKEVFLAGDSRMMRERHAVVSFSYLLYSGDKSISPMKV